MTPGGIYYDNFVFLIFEKLDTFLCDFYRVSLLLMSKEGTFDLGCIHFKLLEGTSTEGV